MNKGINTLIVDTKTNVTNAINEGLKAGLPIAVIDLIIDNAMVEVKQILNKTIADEKVKSEQEQKLKDSQVQYTEQDTVEQ